MDGSKLKACVDRVDSLSKRMDAISPPPDKKRKPGDTKPRTRNAGDVDWEAQREHFKAGKPSALAYETRDERDKRLGVKRGPDGREVSREKFG